MSFDKNHKNIYNNRLFLNLNPEDISLKIQPKNFIEIDEGKIIYKVGDRGDKLFLLLKGQIKLKIYGKNANSSLLKPENDFFGEIEVMENTVRKSAAMAIEKSLLYIITTQELDDLNKNETILVNLIGSTSPMDRADLKDLKELTIEKSQESIPINPSSLDQENYIEDDVTIWEDEKAQNYAVDSDTAEINYEWNSGKFAAAIDLTENKQQNYQPDESDNLSDIIVTINTAESSEDSILDQIKEEIEENLTDLTIENEIRTTNAEQENKKENSPAENISDEPPSFESDNIKLGQSDQLSAKEYLQIIRKITESIYDEIITPAELIKNYANILIGKSSSPKADRILQRIIDQSNIIIESPRTHSDFFAEKITLKSQVFYAANVLEDILQLLANYTEFRNIKLFRKFEADASILVDKNLFYQACLQLIKFLCEYISGEGSIFVAVSRTKEKLIIEFKSTGRQIPDELIKKIMENFILKENPGISFSKRIVLEFNGEMTIQNSNDAGPKIKVLLPIVK